MRQPWLAPHFAFWFHVAYSAKMTSQPEHQRKPEPDNDNLPPDILAGIDRFRLDQHEKPSRSEAIRYLLNDALIALGYKQPD
jgi:hypothetical protein